MTLTLTFKSPCIKSLRKMDKINIALVFLLNGIKFSFHGNLFCHVLFNSVQLKNNSIKDIYRVSKLNTNANWSYFITFKIKIFFKIKQTSLIWQAHLVELWNLAFHFFFYWTDLATVDFKKIKNATHYKLPTYFYSNNVAILDLS